MQGNLAMMNWAQIRLSSSPHRIFGGAKKPCWLAAHGLCRAELSHNKDKTLDFVRWRVPRESDQRWAGVVISSWWGERRDKEREQGGEDWKELIESVGEEESGVLIHCRTTTSTQKSLPKNSKSSYVGNWETERARRSASVKFGLENWGREKQAWKRGINLNKGEKAMREAGQAQRLRYES